MATTTSPIMVMATDAIIATRTLAIRLQVWQKPPLIVALTGLLGNGRPFFCLTSSRFVARFNGGNSQKIGRVENGGPQPLGV